jgi:hypothetical protein
VDGEHERRSWIEGIQWNHSRSGCTDLGNSA